MYQHSRQGILIVTKERSAVNARGSGDLCRYAIVFRYRIRYNQNQCWNPKKGLFPLIKQRHIYRITAAALTAALLFLPGCGTLGSGSAVSSAPAQVEVEKEYARFPRFQDRKVNQDNRVLTLTNWKKSPFRLVYTLSVNGQTIYESPVLEPGEKLEWDILAYCKESCDLDITATAFSKEGKEQNSVTQTIRLTLPKAKKTKKKTQEKGNQQADQEMAAAAQTERKDTP